MALLEVRDLRVHFDTPDGVVKAVDGVSYEVDQGRAIGIVGESGSGKSVSSLTVMGLTRARSARISGTVRFDGKDLLNASDEELRRIRGDEIAMIFQDPLSSLHPFYKIGKQLAEPLRVHRGMSSTAARDHAAALLDRVGIPGARRRLGDFPHEFSVTGSPHRDADRRGPAHPLRHPEGQAARPRSRIAAAGRDPAP